MLSPATISPDATPLPALLGFIRRHPLKALVAAMAGATFPATAWAACWLIQTCSRWIGGAL